MSPNIKKHPVYRINFTDWKTSLFKLLDTANLVNSITGLKKPILIKPNLVEAAEPPITTPVCLVSALIDYIRLKSPDAEIIIGEGCGSTEYETSKPFEFLGYTEMSGKKSVKLIDLNHAPLLKLTNPDCGRWPEMFLPEIVMKSFLLSVPVLKAHSMSDVTLTMKNMLGAAPPKHYNAGSWKKSAFHERIQDAIFDLNRYRTPDFTVLDATVGMQEAHLWGPTCNPAPNLLLASADPVAIDALGSKILKRDWRKIGHIKMADGILGFGEAELVDVK